MRRHRSTYVATLMYGPFNMQSSATLAATIRYELPLAMPYHTSSTGATPYAEQQSHCKTPTHKLQPGLDLVATEIIDKSALNLEGAMRILCTLQISAFGLGNLRVVCRSWFLADE